MRYKPYEDLRLMLRRVYKPATAQHDDGRGHFELGNGDWANPIELGDSERITVERVAPFAIDEYVFTRRVNEFEDMCHFTIKLSDAEIMVTRITYDRARLLVYGE